MTDVTVALTLAERIHAHLLAHAAVEDELGNARTADRARECARHLKRRIEVADLCETAS